MTAEMAQSVTCDASCDALAGGAAAERLCCVFSCVVWEAELSADLCI